jgi:hypothetical protein
MNPLIRTRFAIGVTFLALLPVVFQIQACKDASSVETVKVSLTNSQAYQYPTVGGDEDGATIVVQPNHSVISEIRRNAETNWVATFVYQPTAGYVGSDYAEIEIVTGSDGASPPRNVKRVVFHFDIHN